MFVFFFKQKTAYEMRISDWSSDVCSSDLHVQCKRTHPVGSIRERDVGHGREASSQRGRLVGEDRGGERKRTARKRGRHPYQPPSSSSCAIVRRKIGRASGRARVCPYV